MGYDGVVRVGGGERAGVVRTTVGSVLLISGSSDYGTFPMFKGYVVWKCVGSAGQFPIGQARSTRHTYSVSYLLVAFFNLIQRR